MTDTPEPDPTEYPSHWKPGWLKNLEQQHVEKQLVADALETIRDNN